ncbi:MAG TPA: 1-deoxy-D-xylulose-5-phosphate synthase N-terminal domain-containing protein [Cytophagaceae bacterium]|jgi:transketolase|nr:1-deoxy-D-xylulose-5-phosphate synthase N-terminal domain-containing protein [Cytophagaceae bacterium]
MNQKMKKEEIKELEALSLKVRENIVKMSQDGGCFTGASLSCTDLFVYLYTKFLNITTQNLEDPTRDYLFLSKGHDVPALYGLYAEIGFMEKNRLDNHLNTNDHIYWHPNRNIAGVEFHSGSLGHLPSVAAGVALDCKMKNQTNKIVVVTGDGELNEGSVWETALVAAAYKLDNLILVVDRNFFQANVQTEELIPLESIKDKFQAFGWNAVEIDGHNFEQLENAFTNINFQSSKPTAVIAQTVRGKGLPSIEKRADRWFCNFSHDEVEALLKELHDHKPVVLHSETLTVR